jgi:mitochondrial fission protein ELM1
MRWRNLLTSACAGEFILIGLSVDTIRRGTTMFDRHPTQRAAVIITTGRRTAAVCALTTFHGKRAE